MNLTDLEKRLIRAIAENEFQQHEPGVISQVWVDCIDFPSSSHGGVMASLSRKGLAGAQRDSDGDKCWLTEAGAKVYNQIK